MKTRKPFATVVQRQAWQAERVTVIVDERQLELV
jgi:hypothetical protein